MSEIINITLGEGVLISLIGALSAWLGNVWRDRIAKEQKHRQDIIIEKLKHEKQIILTSKQNDFNLAISSHLSTTVFDRHIAFSEEYIVRMEEAVKLLYQEGASEDNWTDASDLNKIRLKHYLWVPDDMLEQLAAFEEGLRKLGANAEFIDRTERNGRREKDYHAIKIKNNELYKKLLGYSPLSEEIEESIFVGDVKKKVKNMLQTEQLSTLRIQTIKKATSLLSHK